MLTSKEEAKGPELPRWSAGKLLLFRVVFVYLALYSMDVLVFTVQTLIWGRSRHYPALLTGVLWDHLVPWVGMHVLRLQTPVAVENVGGDLPYEFILRGIEVALALVAAAVWTVLDRRRRDYRLLNAWLRVAVRMALAGVMIRYGMSKALPLQFGTLTLHRLQTPVGELQPMGMLWAFMAASKGYTVLSGIVEVAGGVLLLWPEWTTLGALISAGAMANVFVLNVFYDVNQKVRSLNYLLLAVFLLAPYIGQLFRVVMNRRTEPVPETRLSGRRWLRLTMLFLPVGYGVIALSVIGVGNVEAYKVQRRLETATRGDSYGVWVARSFVVEDATKPLLSPKLSAEWELGPGQDHWRRLIVDAGSAAMIQFGDGRWDELRMRRGPEGGSVLLIDEDDPDWRCAVTLSKSGEKTLEMKGTINGYAVTAVFEREDGRRYHLSDPIRWMADGNRDY